MTTTIDIGTLITRSNHLDNRRRSVGVGAIFYFYQILVVCVAVLYQFI
ncbi:MAG: hypothetical protein KME30_04095 [Iphinoe sp. HA4291-MV1]|nr:hypothetical protein [Iphinoe sp. HA4291-MV1]